MAIVAFSLTEDAVAVLRDVLICILKFSEDVTLEAKKDKLTFTTLNLTKSAYLAVTLVPGKFFLKYDFSGNAQHHDRFCCVLYIRALLSVFRSRLGGDATRDRDRDTAIERCDVVIDDGPGVKSRLTAKITCRNGIIATHALPFEVKAPTRAKFDPAEAVNHWTMSSRTLRQLMDHFGRGIELLDISTHGEDVVNFSCFAEKAISVSYEAVLKKPLHTSIAVDIDEFDDIHVQTDLRIIVSVKDFRAILQHAQITSGELSAYYSRPGRPMKLQYGAEGIACEFVLMTMAEKDMALPKSRKGKSSTTVVAKIKEKGATAAAAAVMEATPHPEDSAATRARESSHQPTPTPPPPPLQVSTHRMPPPPSRPTQFEIRPSSSTVPLPLPPPPPPQPSRHDVSEEGSLSNTDSLFGPPPPADEESMFVTQDDGDDDDRQWEPVDADGEDGDEDNPRLEWDVGNERPGLPIMQLSRNLGPEAADTSGDSLPAGIEPTQRLKEVRQFGLFS